MNAQEQEYINAISHDKFYMECLELWRSAGSPVFGDMATLIIEEYNNEAIDAFLEQRRVERVDV